MSHDRDDEEEHEIVDACSDDMKVVLASVICVYALKIMVRPDLTNYSR